MHHVFKLFTLFCLVSIMAYANDESAPGGRPAGRTVPLGVSLHDFDASAITGSSVLLGVEFAQDHYWITAAGMVDSTEPENYLFKVSKAGLLVETFLQPTVSTWGWRDLAFDGSFLYSSDSGVIDQIDMTTGQKTGVTIPSPQSPARGLAYDQATDHFWLANWASDLYEIDRNGTIINQFTNGHSVYGLGLDRFTSGGPFLWAWHQDDLADAAQIQASTGVPTGWEFRSIFPGIAGGIAISESVIPGKLVAITVTQNDGADTIALYDVTPEGGVVPSLGPAGLGILAFLLLCFGFIIVRQNKG